MNNLKRGQLVYIPSGVNMVKYDKNHNPASVFKVKDPIHVLLVITSTDDEVGVHHNGGVWYVKVGDVYINSFQHQRRY